MKVVLFCGGTGMRMRVTPQDSTPKPMAPIGGRPVVWHIMQYYAHFGHTEFILCLGHGANALKDYFLHYRETYASWLKMSSVGQPSEASVTDVSGWRITFVDTGLNTPIGERLRRVRRHLDGDAMFLANYGDVLTDAPLPRIVDIVANDAEAAGGLLAVAPSESFHALNIDAEQRLTAITPARALKLRINGGYFILRQDIFSYLRPGDDLVMGGCLRAAQEGRFKAIPYDGFWTPMDTVKEQMTLEEMYGRGHRPWALWQSALDRVPDARLELSHGRQTATSPKARSFVLDRAN